MSRREEEQKRHEFTLMEMRLMGEDIKTDNRELLSQLCEKRIKPIENRVNTLEHWRTALSTGFTIILGYLNFKK